MAKRGRPLKEIDKKQFENLCVLQCTLEEICGFFEVSDKTLENWCKRTYDGMNFSEIFAQKRSKGKISLRRYQFQMAAKNPTMAIWLGKQWLGQAEQQKVEILTQDDDPLSIAFMELEKYGHNEEPEQEATTDTSVSE